MKLIIIGLSALFALVNSHGVRYLQPIHGRIIGGQNARIEDVPYQVALLSRGNQICGGSIIAPNWVLTAAHCVIGYTASSITIAVGTARWSAGGTRHRVSRIISHPLYNVGIPIDYDYALLAISDLIPIGSTTVQAIPLATSDAPGGEMALVSGWGQDHQRIAYLKKVNVPVVSRSVCRRSYEAANYIISDRMMCAGWTQGGDNTCYGDSGGPLVLNGRQIGIVSWALGCASAGYPTVFADVANQRNWIREQTGV